MKSWTKEDCINFARDNDACEDLIALIESMPSDCTGEDVWNSLSPDFREWVAGRIAPEHLPELMDDESWWVRRAVALRIAPEYLPGLMTDDAWQVREAVAERIEEKKERAKKMNKVLDKMFAPIVTKRIDEKKGAKK